MHACCINSVVDRTEERPILLAKAESAEGGGGCREAQTSGSNSGWGISWSRRKRASFGGNFGRWDVETEGSLATFVTNRFET